MTRLTFELDFATAADATQWKDAIKVKCLQVRDDELLPAWTGANIGVFEIFLDSVADPVSEDVLWVP